MDIPFEVIPSDSNSKWIVFVHGFGGSRKMFKKQVDMFKKHFNLLIIDLPGHGESCHGLAENSKFNLNDVAKEIIQLLKDLGIKTASFIGISLGTLVIADIATLQPDIIDKLVLGGAICGISGFWMSLVQMVNFLRDIIPWRISVSMFAYIMMPMKNHKKSREFMIKESINMGKQEFKRWFSIITHEMNYMRENITNISRQNSLFIMGSQDHVFMHNVKNLASKYGIDLKVINKCGHVCNIEKSQEFNKVALNYLLD